jgi:hypothetical protein
MLVPSDAAEPLVNPLERQIPVAECVDPGCI